jgi:hypothetical protein
MPRRIEPRTRTPVVPSNMVGRADWKTGRMSWANVVSISLGYCYGTFACGVLSVDRDQQQGSQADKAGATEEHSEKGSDQPKERR